MRPSLWHRATALGLLFSGLIGCNQVAFSPTTLDSQGKIDPCPTLPCPTYTTEPFYFNTARPKTKVDVLFVIDNSGSMLEEQQKLAPRLSAFVSTLKGVDWQIGITTTDVSTDSYSMMGRLVNFVGTGSHILTKDTPNYERVFLDTVTANGTPPGCTTTCPSGDEQPLGAVNLAISKRNTDNRGFFRAGADFAVIVLSDEDEMSTGEAVYNPTTPGQLMDTVNTTWGGNKTFTGFGIVIEPGDTTCFNTQSATGGHYGTFVSELALRTGGVTGSICDTDYSAALTSIGQRVKRLATSVQLTADPVAGSVRVTMVPADPSITFEVLGRTVRFSDLPHQGTKVDITYEKVP